MWKSENELGGLVSCHSRLFVFENIPQLKYHNPGVRFSVERHRGEESKISFTLGEDSISCVHSCTRMPGPSIDS